ncbi:D-alanine--poly(phosphoribitol) ligase subunit DltA [Levilactobacillus bambusae]|uniref:D-alanine--D-alanyl carrier protein ligase n=1 Tax=Levilactobacillus bambusae TaxID=2024736 RepID=A0A2V1N0K1_9LACO|nr:D-alanine--poly(phosphoribitol) ligase subunit DltA [Levilactobacillus bambusae]PWG00744.1 D-alanine--poly(phosphoribitol) ligase subunit 1 [Levilactobacillus bambusae]
MITNMITTIDDYGQSDPDRIAYNYLGQTHTYGELKCQSDALAAHLDQMKLPSGAPIIVFGGQTFEMIATFLGVVKSGHAYIPVDTHSAKDRVPIIAEVASPALVIAVEALPTEVPDVSVMQADELTEVFSQSVQYEMTHAVSGDETYYIIFTSGTTGKPKGVQISHSNLVSYVNWMLSDDFKLPDQPRTLSQAPYAFDLSVMDWGPTMAKGGTLVALPKAVTDNFKELFEDLPQMNLNVWVSTPSFIEICLLAPEFDAEHLPDLAVFLFCGEELTNGTAATLRAKFPQARIYNTYGPTETTVAVTGVEITADILRDYARLPIGYVKEDMTIDVVDEDLNRVPAGEKGELLISGPSMSKGYLNNPDKTAKAFIDWNGKRVYRSGDLGYQLENGLFMYDGRTDFQIKMHGYRIELEEVDHYLNRVPYVKQAVTVPHYNKNHMVDKMIAWVVPAENVHFDSELDMTKAIKSELTKGDMMPYMIPQQFVYKQSLPITPNGKVDVKSIIAEVNN